MPPRVPIVLLFVVVYFAALVGGGPAALGMAAPESVWPFGDRLALTVGESLAFAAAAAAMVDAAWRPARGWTDATVSVAVAALTVGALWLRPDLLSSNYAVLSALAVGDALAALGRPGAARRRAEAAR